MVLFNLFFQGETVKQAMLLWRFITYYSTIVVGMFFARLGKKGPELARPEEASGLGQAPEGVSEAPAKRDWFLADWFSYPCQRSHHRKGLCVSFLITIFGGFPLIHPSFSRTFKLKPKFKKREVFLRLLPFCKSFRRGLIKTPTASCF